jgi:hypothetical protein
MGKTFKTGWKRKPRDAEGKILSESKEESKDKAVEVKKADRSG